MFFMEPTLMQFAGVLCTLLQCSKHAYVVRPAITILCAPIHLLL